MSKSIHKPWLVNYVLDVLNSTDPISKSTKCVQIVGCNSQIRCLTISDTAVSIPAFLTEDCFRELMTMYSPDTLRNGQINLVNYHLSTVTQALGCTEVEKLQTLNLPFPLALHCSKVTFLGGSDCNIIGDPKNLNKRQSIVPVLRSMLYYQLKEKLGVRQFPKQRSLPDFEWTFERVLTYNEDNPLLPAHFEVPAAQVRIIDALNSFEMSHIVQSLPGLLQDEFGDEQQPQVVADAQTGGTTATTSAPSSTASTPARSSSRRRQPPHRFDPVVRNQDGDYAHGHGGGGDGSLRGDGWMETVREEHDGTLEESDDEEGKEVVDDGLIGSRHRLYGGIPAAETQCSPASQRQSQQQHTQHTLTETLPDVDYPQSDDDNEKEREGNEEEEEEPYPGMELLPFTGTQHSTCYSEMDAYLFGTYHSQQPTESGGDHAVPDLSPIVPLSSAATQDVVPAGETQDESLVLSSDDSSSLVSMGDEEVNAIAAAKAAVAEGEEEDDNQSTQSTVFASALNLVVNLVRGALSPARSRPAAPSAVVASQSPVLSAGSQDRSMDTTSSTGHTVASPGVVGSARGLPPRRRTALNTSTAAASPAGKQAAVSAAVGKVVDRSNPAFESLLDHVLQYSSQTQAEGEEWGPQQQEAELSTSSLQSQSQSQSQNASTSLVVPPNETAVTQDASSLPVTAASPAAAQLRSPGRATGLTAVPGAAVAPSSVLPCFRFTQQDREALFAWSQKGELLEEFSSAAGAGAGMSAGGIHASSSPSAGTSSLTPIEQQNFSLSSGSGTAATLLLSSLSGSTQPPLTNPSDLTSPSTVASTSRIQIIVSQDDEDEDEVQKWANMHRPVVDSATKSTSGDGEVPLLTQEPNNNGKRRSSHIVPARPKKARREDDEDEAEEAEEEEEKEDDDHPRPVPVQPSSPPPPPPPQTRAAAQKTPVAEEPSQSQTQSFTPQLHKEKRLSLEAAAAAAGIPNKLDAHTVSVLLKRRVIKKFGDEWFEGTVAGFKQPFFKIRYDDGDTEDMNIRDVKM